MTKKMNFLPAGAALLLLGAAAVPQTATAQMESSGNPELDQELYYIKMLGDRLMMPDYAEFVLNQVKVRFPEAGPLLKVLQIEQQLGQGKFDDVRKVIAAEADPESEEVWAMKSTMADYLYAYGQYDEALGIYQGLVKKYGEKPPEALLSFYSNSLYKYAQMLIRIGKSENAVGIYETYLKLPLSKDAKRPVQFDAAELLVNVAEEQTDGSKKSALLAKGKKICEEILWVQDLWFGKGVALLARIRVIQGDVAGAQKLVTSYLPTVKQIDDALMEQGKETGEDYSSLSPAAQCRFLTGKMLWLEAKKVVDAMDKEGRTDFTPEEKQQVVECLVGKKNEDGTKTTGAYQELLNVYLNYPGANDAPEAMELCGEIENLMVSRQLARSIRPKNVTPEKQAEVARRQFDNARISFNMSNWEEAAGRFRSAINQFPADSGAVSAISSLAQCYINLAEDAKRAETMDDKAVEGYEIFADMVVGHLAEQFGRAPQAQMSDAGNELRRIADIYENKTTSPEKAKVVYDRFFSLFPDHPMAAPLLMTHGETAFKAEDYDTAVQNYYNRLAYEYTNSPLSIDALSRIAEIHRKREEPKEEIKVLVEMSKRLGAEAKPGQRYINVQYLLAQAVRGMIPLATLHSDDPAKVELANKNLKTAIGRYQSIVKMLEGDKLANYQANDEEAARNRKILESCYFGTALGTSQLTEKGQEEANRLKAIETYENFLKKFPDSDQGARVLNQIGTLWITAGDNEKADAAFTRLASKYPDSEESKLALFMQGRALIELGHRNEGLEKLRQMFADTSKYKPGQMLSVGDELKTAREWDLAEEAYRDALKRAADNEGVSMRAMLGLADVLAGKKDLAGAARSYEEFVAKYPKSGLMVDASLSLSRVASQLAVDTSDAQERKRLFDASVKAMKDVRKHRTEPAELAATDNDIGDILIRQASAEEKFGDKEIAAETRRAAVSHFIPILDASDPKDETTSPHVQKSYKTAIGIMVDLKEYSDALVYCEQYLNDFPSGLYTTDIRTWYNEAKANAGE